MLGYPGNCTTSQATIKATGSYETHFSRKAMKYKEWKLNDKHLTENNYRQYILTEYTFLKRSVVIIDDKIFVGQKENSGCA